MSQKDRAAAIILANACAGAVAASRLANLFAIDTLVLAPVIRRMIERLAETSRRELGPGEAAQLAARLAVSCSGEYLAGKLLAWIPFVGNQTNAQAVFEATQIVGWAAFGLFDAGLSRDEALRFARAQIVSKERLDVVLSRMPADDRARYEALKRVIGSISASGSDKSSAAREMAQFVIKGSA